jgi:hypothetical protein
MGQGREGDNNLPRHCSSNTDSQSPNICVVKLISSTESEWFVVLFAATERAEVAATCPTVHLMSPHVHRRECNCLA